jgi:hypothetical protein
MLSLLLPSLSSLPLLLLSPPPPFLLLPHLVDCCLIVVVVDVAFTIAVLSPLLM